jgi:hypothetical protein
MAATRALWSSAVTTISDTIFKSKGMGRERSRWGCSSRAHLGQRRLGEGDRRGRPSSVLEQRRWPALVVVLRGKGRGREQAGRCLAGWASHWSFYSRGKAVPRPGGAHTELVRLQWRFGRRVCGGVNALLWSCCWTRLVEQQRHLVVCEPGNCSGERRRDAGGGLWPWWRSEVMAQAGEAAGSKWWRCSTGRGGQRWSYGGLRCRDMVVLCSQGDDSTAAALVARCGVRGERQGAVKLWASAACRACGACTRCRADVVVGCTLQDDELCTTRSLQARCFCTSGVCVLACCVRMCMCACMLTVELVMLQLLPCACRACHCCTCTAFAAGSVLLTCCAACCSPCMNRQHQGR